MASIFIFVDHDPDPRVETRNGYIAAAITLTAGLFMLTMGLMGMIAALVWGFLRYMILFYVGVLLVILAVFFFFVGVRHMLLPACHIAEIRKRHQDAMRMRLEDVEAETDDDETADRSLSLELE